MVELVEATSCTSCGSTDIRPKRRYTRFPRTLDGVETVVVVQHECRDCKKTFTDTIRGTKQGAQIADEVKERAADLYLEGPDLEGVKKVMCKFGVNISASAIWYAVNRFGKLAVTVYDRVIGLIKPSGFACVDEKFVSVHGKKRPQLFGIDPITGIPLIQKLLRNREETTITRVMRRLRKMGVRVVCTDDLKSYSPSVKTAGMRHNKCNFHAKHTFHKRMKKAHIQKKRKEKFIKWCHKFLDSKDMKEAVVRRRVLGRITDKKLQRFMKSFLHNWPDYFTYLEFEGCPKTTNPVEQYNRRYEQKRQIMHGLRKEKTAREFNALFALHSMFRKFEEGTYKGLSPLEIACAQLRTTNVFAFLNE